MDTKSNLFKKVALVTPNNHPTPNQQSANLESALDNLIGRDSLRTYNACNEGTSHAHWVLYLLECKNGHYYTGITIDLSARYKAHLAGKGAKYTRANPPVSILASQHYPTRSQASIAEAKLKKLPRDQKLAFFVAG